MSITIRFASWNIENYGSSKDTKSRKLPKLIAKTMELYKIDILAILEMKKNGYTNIHQKILTELNNHQNAPATSRWKGKFVNVGNEGVSFFWHEAAVGSANAFKAKTYTNHQANQANQAEAIAEKVLKDNAGNRIYFPMRKTYWSSLPGKPEGRRPAFCAFETNIGGTATTFTFLDIHTPFADGSDNNYAYIQAYSAYLYATSREISEVQTFDSVSAAINAKTPAQAAAGKAIGTEFPRATNAQKSAVAQKAIDAITSEEFIDRWRDEIVAGIDFKKIAKEAAKVAAASAAQEAKAKDFDKLTSASGTTGDGAVVEAAAAAGAAAATYIFAEASTTPSSVSQAANAANNAVSNVNYVPPAKKQKTSTGVSSAAKNAAIDAAKEGVDTITFSSIAGLDVSSVTASALAGDFNINYPDSGTYPKPVLSPPNGAYDKLLKLQSSSNPAINEKTTQKHNLGGGTNNDTASFRANAYDNIFASASPFAPNSGESIDMLSELGSWSAGPGWPAAQKRLNAIAKDFLVKYPDSDINKGLPTATDAAAFYKRYMSDHYPVFVEVTIP